MLIPPWQLEKLRQEEKLKEVEEKRRWELEEKEKGYDKIEKEEKNKDD